MKIQDGDGFFPKGTQEDMEKWIIENKKVNKEQMLAKMDKILEFQSKYPTKEEKEEALKKMTDEEIDELINSTTNIQARVFYSSFKHKEQ